MWPLVIAGAALYALSQIPDSKPRRKRRSKAKGRSPARETEWHRAERRACDRRGLKHHGGPGKADCGRTVEVKTHARPIDSGIVLRELEKGRTEIVSRSGFTGPARELAKAAGVRLRRT